MKASIFKKPTDFQGQAGILSFLNQDLIYWSEELLVFHLKEHWTGVILWLHVCQEPTTLQLWTEISSSVIFCLARSHCGSLSLQRVQPEQWKHCIGNAQQYQLSERVFRKMGASDLTDSPLSKWDCYPGLRNSKGTSYGWDRAGPFWTL